MNDNLQRVADTAAPIGWLVWYFSHVAQINQMLQSIALLAAIFGTVAAGIFHLIKSYLMWRNRHKR